MRMGSLARSQSKFVALCASLATLVPVASFGQSRNAAYEFNESGDSQRPMQALYMSPANGAAAARTSRYVDAYGNPIIEQAQYCEQGGDCNEGCVASDGCGPSAGCGPGGYCGPQSDFNGCFPMGAGGTDPPNGYELMNDVGMEGPQVDQRGPHYWDVRAEAVFLQRDKTFEQNIDITSLNVGNNVVLSTRQLDVGENTGFRVMGRYDIGPCSVVEVGYMGVFDWNSSASFSDPNPGNQQGNLYSLFSRPAPGTGAFGTDPVPPEVPIGQGVNDPGGVMPETERALRHSISFDSDLQTAEISYRRYWLGYIPRISGTLLAGFRYTKVNEEFEFKSQGFNFPVQAIPPGLTYDLNARNNLAGFQTGADMWIALMQGLRIGTEGKVGLYDNHSLLRNKITTTPGGTFPPTLFEEFEGDHAAFLTEGSVDLVADLTPSISLRAGYEVMFLNQLVLAGRNFNQVSPYGNQGMRVPFVDDSGDLTYSGGHVGIEYIW